MEIAFHLKTQVSIGHFVQSVTYTLMEEKEINTNHFNTQKYQQFWYYFTICDNFNVHLSWMYAYGFHTMKHSTLSNLPCHSLPLSFYHNFCSFTIMRIVEISCESASVKRGMPTVSTWNATHEWTSGIVSMMQGVIIDCSKTVLERYSLTHHSIYW